MGAHISTGALDGTTNETGASLKPSSLGIPISKFSHSIVGLNPNSYVNGFSVGIGQLSCGGFVALGNSLITHKGKVYDCRNALTCYCATNY